MIEIEKVVDICEAYESGYTAGRMHIAINANEFKRESEQYYAWVMGHNVGVQTEFLELDDIYIN